MTEMFADEDSARFFQMIQMLQRSTLLQMGYLPDQSGTYHYNMGENARVSRCSGCFSGKPRET